MLLLHHALSHPDRLRESGREKRDAKTLGIGLAVSFEIGEPGGICTLNPPADNGALRLLSYESEMACRAVARLKIVPASALRASARQPRSGCASSEGW